MKRITIRIRSLQLELIHLGVVLCWFNQHPRFCGVHRRSIWLLSWIEISDNVQFGQGSQRSCIYGLPVIGLSHNPRKYWGVGRSLFDTCHNLRSLNSWRWREHQNDRWSLVLRRNGTTHLVLKRKEWGLRDPNTIRIIDPKAFNKCKKLASITIPDSVTHIEDDAFGDCCHLESISIPPTIIWMGKDVFDKCYSLQTVSIPRDFEYSPDIFQSEQK
mgnify:CR=1 FL=1